MGSARLINTKQTGNSFLVGVFSVDTGMPLQ